MWFNMHINVGKIFHMNYHMWVMHVIWNYDLLVITYQT
jgi:hypothetical protein